MLLFGSSKVILYYIESSNEINIALRLQVHGPVVGTVRENATIWARSVTCCTPATGTPQFLAAEQIQIHNGFAFR